MAIISGKYTTKRDGGLAYTYEAAWNVVGNDIEWAVKASRGDDFAGSTSGVFHDSKVLAPSMGHILKRWAEDTIENRVGVD